MSSSLAETHASLRAFGATDRGQVREYNEDVVLLRPDLGLFVLADGAGGHQAGRIAAEVACETLAGHMEQSASGALEQDEFDRFGISSEARRLSRAVHLANQRVMELSRSSEQHRGMGTTIVAASYVARHGTLHVAHVGDSRCYRLRQGHLEALTEDHCLLTDVLEERPELDETRLAKLPKNVVTRALGMGTTLRVALRSHSLSAGDRYLLCSDGLSGCVNAEQLATLLGQHEPPRTIVEHLISLANQCKAPDNVGALVLAIDGESAVSSRKQKRMASPVAALRESDPELLILGIEDLDLAQHLYSASDGLLEQLGELARKKPQT
jgi:protein phosphatase